MRATARGRGGTVDLRIEGITPCDGDAHGAGEKPSPEKLLAASLASCTATTIERYARRKGWKVGLIEVDAEYTPAQRGSPTRCTVVVRLSENLSAEQRDRLMQIGATSEVHRILEGEILFDERVELASTEPGADHRSQRARGRGALHARLARAGRRRNVAWTARRSRDADDVGR